ncbi:MAG TPA: hypothetical protein VNB90_15490 [Cytophagaceae bacterium]|nr:hypothetical protein [Cytophagaceae bacterium]
MKTVFYKSLVGIVLIALLYLLCNAIYRKIYWQEDLKKNDEHHLLEQFQNGVQQSDILYFAESSNASFVPSDSIRKSISSLTNDYYPNLRIGAVEKGAMHAGIFKTLIRQIPDSSKVKAIVVTMNLRSFGIIWINSIYENYCEQLSILYSGDPPLYNKLRLVFKMYDYEEDWQRKERWIKEFKDVKLKAPFPLKYQTIHQWDKELFALPDSANYNKVLATQFVKLFGFNIDTVSNPRIKDFDEIVKICQKKNIHLYFNLLAENTQAAQQLTGNELVQMMLINKNLLIDRYQKNGVTVVNNLQLVNDEDFTDRDFPSEHYDQTGRQIIAANLAKALQKDFSQYYKEPK